MYEKADLQRMTGFSTDQLNDRLGRLRPHFAEDFQSGKRSKVIVTDRVAAALRRMRELEDDGLGPQDAIDRILGELPEQREEPQQNGSPKVAEVWQTLAEERQDRIKSLEKEHERLLAIIENQSEQIRALAPGPNEAKGQPSSNGNGMSRWQHLKAVLLGG